jgi:hypothetical protein
LLPHRRKNPDPARVESGDACSAEAWHPAPKLAVGRRNEVTRVPRKHDTRAC